MDGTTTTTSKAKVYNWTTPECADDHENRTVHGCEVTRFRKHDGTARAGYRQVNRDVYKDGATFRMFASTDEGDAAADAVAAVLAHAFGRLHAKVDVAARRRETAKVAA